MEVAAFAVGWATITLLTTAIGPSRGYAPITAFALGLGLGLIGLLIVLLVKGSVPTPAEVEERRRREGWQEWMDEHGGHAFSAGPLPPQRRHR